MTLKEKAEEKGNEYIPLKKQNVYARLQRKGYKDGYIAGANEVKADCDFAIEGRDVKIKELKEELEDWKSDHEHQLELMKGLNDRITDLEKQTEKMKCCQNCEIFTYHNYASCGEPILLDKSHGTYVCAKWKQREKWDDNSKISL